MLEFKKIELKSACLGECNNIPDITTPKNPLWFECDQTISQNERKNVGVGMVASVLPYRMQNLYDRDFKARQYNCAVLENEYLKAEFIPELGGRLWSLYDKKLKKDIIYKNDALIFGNLAIRNAWFAGGVEWNVGVRGHSHFTCSPVFARKIIGKQGHEILRMYEYEEIRGLVYCIEATLEKDKLIMNFTAKNTKSVPTYMYWWSNIAVEQKEGTKCYVPANRSFVTSYREGGFRISKIDVPYHNGKDISDPYHAHDAIDYFFDIPDENKKWISAIEKDGKGLLQYSSNRLIGRKVFLWGNIPGGEHWNQWLTDGRDYLEIQAGLCKTQFEHFLIDPYEEITWNEVYTGIDVGNNQGNYFEVCNKIDAHVPEKIDFQSIFAIKKAEPIALYGRGKGYLYQKVNSCKFHEKCEFPSNSVSKDEAYYLDILEGNDAKGDESTAFVCGKEWLEIFKKKDKLSAFDKYILAIIYYLEADFDNALAYFKQSVKEEEKFYSLAALGLLLSNVYGDQGEALSYMRKAIDSYPDYLPIAIKYGEIAIRSRAFNEFINYYDNAPEKIKNAGRIKMYMGQCLVEVGELNRAKGFINKSLVVEDFKEGEYAVSNVWVMLYKREMAAELGCETAEITDAQVLEKHPLPFEIDFRMH